MTERSTQRVPARRSPAEPDAGARLWLSTLQELTTRVSHELRNAMNGVAVNLEVVRSRAERPDTRADAVRPFADAAAAQFAVTVGLVEALTALARPAREPLDVAAYVSQLTAALGPVLEASGGTLDVELPAEATAATSAPADVVRALLGAALLGATTAEGGHLRLRVTVTAEVTVHIEGASGGVPSLPPAVCRAAVAAGVRVAPTGATLTVSLPGPVAGNGRRERV